MSNTTKTTNTCKHSSTSLKRPVSTNVSTVAMESLVSLLIAIKWPASPWCTTCTKKKGSAEVFKAKKSTEASVKQAAKTDKSMKPLLEAVDGPAGSQETIWTGSTVINCSGEGSLLGHPDACTCVQYKRKCNSYSQVSENLLSCHTDGEVIKVCYSLQEPENCLQGQ